MSGVESELTSDEYNFDEIDEDLLIFQEDEMVQQALQRGVDLKKYGRELEKDLRNAESDSVLQYVDNHQKVVDLHKQMHECDSILSRMQDMLYGFQSDLSGISEEIKHLQDESLSMSVKLKNRKAVEEKLHDYLDKTTLSMTYVESIISNEITEDFLQAVIKLNEKLLYLQHDASEDTNIAYTTKSLLPDLEQLKLRSITKINDYFTKQFRALKQPKTNVQVVQQNALIKYAKLLHFLQSEAPLLGEELRNMYIESMGKTIMNLFKSYSTQLLKLDIILATKYDALVVEDSTMKSVFIQKVDMSKKIDPFVLGERERFIEQVESEPILLHVAIAENQKYPFEAILRSIIKHLSDSATSEFLFILDFFKTNTRDTFNKIFAKTLSLLLEYLENYLLNCYDTLSLLLMIRITYLQRMIMQRRRIPVLDSFFDRISLLLWPRLKASLDIHMKSLKTANPKKLGPLDLLPHYITKRYSELILSLVLIQGISSSTNPTAGVQTGSSNNNNSNGNVPMIGLGSGGEIMLQNDLLLLRTEMIGLLEKMSQMFSLPMERIVFLINNYDQIVSRFQERRIICEESQQYELLLLQQREMFAEEQVRYTFPRLISFVLQTEQLLIEVNKSNAGVDHTAAGVSGSSGGSSGSNGPVSIMLDEQLVESLVREFNGSWKQGVQQINDNVLAYFANFKNGMEILKQVLTQLLLYYTRFQDIIKKSFNRPPAFVREIVSTATILMEIKRYSRSL